METATIVGATPTFAADVLPSPQTRGTGRGSFTIEVATGDVAVLGADSVSALRLRDAFFPAFTPDGSAAWLSRANWTDARRYGLDGTLTESIEGAWAVTESPDARSRAYYLRDGGDLTRELVVERDGEAHRFEGRHALPSFSPDGETLAYYSIDDDNMASLVLLDLDSGETRIVGTDVDPCACDLTPPPQWSPSGSYIAYYDFAGQETASGFGEATIVVEVASGKSHLAGAGAPPGDASGWLWDEAVGERLIVVDYAAGSVALYEPTAGSVATVFQGSDAERLADIRRVGQFHIQIGSVVVSGDDARHATRLLDGRTGESLAHWDYEGSATITADGPALAVSSHALDTGGCAGVLVIHPAIDVPRCLDGVDDAIWSPDGSLLATATTEASRRTIGTWDPVAAHRVVADVDSGVLIGWNADGTHLLVSDVTGL